MKTKLRKFCAGLMALALAFIGAGAYTANAGSLPSEGIYGFMRLSVASESIGKGKVSLNSNCQQNMSSATYWKDKDGPVLSGKDSTEPGLYYCDWKPAHPLIEFYVYAKPNDGYKIEGLYLDDECKHPISENAEILVDWFISGGQYSNVPEKIKSLIPYATYTPAEASMWALNVKTVDITKAQPTDIYVKFVAPVAKIEGKGEYVTLQAAFAAVKPSETVELLCDVDLGGEAWTPVQLNGNFDGRGFAVSNLVVSAPDQNGVGFFSEMKQEYAFTVKNVDFVNVDVKGKSNVGALFGWHCYGLVSNVTVSGTIKVEATGGDGDGYTRAGVICGGWSYGTYVDVTVDGGDKTVSYVKGPKSGVDGRYVAGFVGHSDEGDSYRNCTVKNLTVSGKWLSGGLCGDGPGHGPCVNCTVEDVALTGYYSGALFGWFWDFGSQPPVVENATIRNVTFGNKSGCGTVGGYEPDLAVIVKNVTIEGVEPLAYNYQVYVTEDGDNYHYADVETAIAEAEKLEDITVASDKIEIPDGYVRYVKGDLWGVREADLVVRVGEIGYPSIAAALAASSGEVEITLIANAKSGTIELSNSKNSQVDSLTIDLNGFTLTDNGGDAFKTENRLITVKDSVGTGVFDHIGTDDCVWTKGSTGGVVLESGTYHLVDAYGLAYGVPSLLVIKGGTYNINPGSDKYGRNYVPAGYEFTDNGDGTWTVKQVMVAEIVGGQKFATLAEALAAVQDGETVKVLKSGNVVTGYAKQIGEEGYDEGAGANRLVFGTDPTKPFTLDLNGLTLSGRLNVTSGVMTVANGTLRAATQAVNIFGTMDIDYTNKVWTSVTIAADATVRSDTYGLCVFAGDPGNTSYPFGFGEVFNVYGKVYSSYYAAFIIGTIGNCQYKYDASNGYPGTRRTAYITETLGMSFGEVMRNFGPKINVYDGAVMESTEEGGQGIAIQGCTTVNVYGGSITGNEAIGVKGGFLNVYGGKLTATGAKWDPVTAVHSGTEQSGAAIAVTTYYQTQNPIVVNVTGGTMQSLSNSAMLVAHSYSGGVPTKASLGVSVTVAGGTFIGGEGQPAILVEPAVAGEEGKYPANFITAKLDEDGKETGYPLCNSPIPAEYIAVGYKEKDNENKTWTVTAMTPEIVVDPEEKFDEKKYVDDQGQTKTPTDAEKTAADKAVKELETVYQDPVLTKVEGTGVTDAAVEPPTQPGEQPKLKPSVVAALNASPGKPDGVTFVAEDGSNSWSHLVIKLKSTTTKVVTETATIKTSVNEMKVDVKPIIEVTPIKDGEELPPFEVEMPASAIPPEGITFPLFVSEAFRGKWAKVEHGEDPVYETEVQEDEKNRPFVMITAKHFSEWLLSVIETSSKAVKRESDGKGYNSFDEAIKDPTTAADETFTLLKNTDEVVKLGAKQTIVTDGKTFGGIDESVLSGWTEAVNTDGKVFIAPKKANVPVSGEEGAPVIRVRMRAEGATSDEDNVEALKAEQANGRPLWQNMALGVANNFRLIPMIPRSAIGFKTITIRSNLDTATVKAAAKQRDGVAVKFQLLKKVGAGDYVQCGEVQDKPVFNVEADDLEPRTFWKIQTIFSEEY